MTTSPFEYINALNDHKDVEDLEDYNHFLTTRFYSLFKDTVFVANLANEINNLDNDVKFRFYRSLISKRKRFTKWPKANPEVINMLCEYFQFSFTKALEAEKILTDEQIASIKEWQDERMRKNGIPSA